MFCAFVGPVADMCLSLHYSHGCMHCELNVTGPSPSDGGDVGGGVVVVVGMV